MVQCLLNLPDKSSEILVNKHIPLVPLNQALPERGQGGWDLNEHPKGLISQKGLGMWDQPGRRNGVHRGCMCRARGGGRETSAGPVSQGDWVEGVTGDVPT